MKNLLLLQVVILLSASLGMAQINEPLLDSIVTYSHYENQDSIRAMKFQNRYNDSSQLISHTVYSWNSELHRWEGTYFPCEMCYPGSGRRIFVYDERGNNIWSESHAWKRLENKWELVIFSKKVYDIQGNNTVAVYGLQNFDGQEVSLNSMREYSYNEEYRISSQIIYDWISEYQHWDPRNKYNYLYNATGETTQQNRYNWNDSTGTWQNYLKTNWEFTPDGTIKEKVRSKWEWVNTEYDWLVIDSDKYEFEYDSIGNCLLITGFRQNYSSGWYPFYRKETVYNDSGWKILEIISDGPGELSEDLRTQWEYDSDGKMIKETVTGRMQRFENTVVIPSNSKVIRSFDSSGNRLVEIWHHLDRESNVYVLSSKDIYYYSTTAGNNEIAIDPVSIFPNPTSGLINITGLIQPAEVNIFSIHGQLLKSEYRVENSIDISNLPTGLYILNLTIENSVIKKTIVKK